MVYPLFEQKATCPISLGWNKSDGSISEDKSLNIVTTRNKITTNKIQRFFMVNADLHVGDGANNKQSQPIKDGNYYKVNERKKGTPYYKIFHQNIRGLGKKAEELLSHLHQTSPIFYA